MKVSIIIVRILVGLLFLFASTVVLFKLMPIPEAKGAVKVFMNGVLATGYLFPLIQITELLCALAFLSGRLAKLATVVIFPITLNILFYHIFVMPEGLPLAVVMMAANLFLAYCYRDNYKSLLEWK